MARMKNPDPRTDQFTASEGLVRLGIMVLHSLHATLRVVGMLLGGLFGVVWYAIRQAARGLGLIWAVARYELKESSRPTHQAMQDVKRARTEGLGAFLRQILRLIGMLIFGEHGLLRTGYNYILPVVSVLFLIGLVKYGLGLDYGLSVAVNGEELGIISDESDFEAAKEELRQRIVIAGEDLDFSFTPVYTLKIVSDDDQFISTHAIADRLLAGSHSDLKEAYGVYIDGRFIGAVEDKSVVSDRMDQELANYASMLENNVSEVFYTKEVTYQKGIYLVSSMWEPRHMIMLLTESEEKESLYTVCENDSPQLVAAKFHMPFDQFEEMNPSMGESLRVGQKVKVITTDRLIPIAYKKNMTLTSFINYTSVKVESSALNLGVEKVISPGVPGERATEVCVTYIDGIEQSREVLNTVVTKEPIPEQIGIGTYTPAPASSGTIVSGNGKYGWPVNGGRISDHFGGERRHKGFDIAAPTGTEIYAAEAGTVYRAGWNSGGYGFYVIIDHPDGFRTLYAHCSSVVAYEGQQVEKGQLISYVGSTGDSTGPHLHFEVRINNICTNPEDYLRVNAD